MRRLSMSDRPGDGRPCAPLGMCIQYGAPLEVYACVSMTDNRLTNECGGQSGQPLETQTHVADNRLRARKQQPLTHTHTYPHAHAYPHVADNRLMTHAQRATVVACTGESDIFCTCSGQPLNAMYIRNGRPCTCICRIAYTYSLCIAPLYRGECACTCISICVCVDMRSCLLYTSDAADE